MKISTQLSFAATAAMLLSFTIPAFAKTVTFNVSDSRGNSTGQCIVHRADIVDIKPCEKRFGDSEFEVSGAANLGHIKMQGKCLGLNKARADVWSTNSPVSLVSCDDNNFIALTWECRG